MAKITENQKAKLYEKSDKICIKCGKQVYKHEDMELIQTKRKTVLILHHRCL